jgi:hypothetical protein
VKPGVGMGEPAGGLARGDACPQTLNDRRGGGCRGCFQPGHGVLRLDKWRPQRMRVSVARRYAARERHGGWYEPSRLIGVRGFHHEAVIAQGLSHQDETNETFSVRMSCRSAG